MQLKFPHSLPRAGALTFGTAVIACAAAFFAAMQMPARAWRASSLADLIVLCTTSEPAASEFTRENNSAMVKMMYEMTITPSSDVDRDFAEMMIAHHQGAIDMALAELRHGSNEQLRRIAQEIIVEQQQEIAAMRLALGQPLPPSAPAPTQAARM